MRKLLAILLALIFVFALAACATGGKPSPQVSEQPSAPVPPSEAASPSVPASPSEAASPAADDDWAYIKAKGELIIGITEYAPMNYYDANGKLIGFDTEYAEAVCAKLGVKPKFVIINWSTKEIELAAKTIDCIWNGLTVTEERRKNMEFTTSYIINEQVVVVKAENVSKYTDKASLSGVAVVAEAESAGQAAIEADLPDAAFTAVDTQATLSSK